MKISEMEEKLLKINVFVGGLTDKMIVYYYKKYIDKNVEVCLNYTS